MTNGMAYLVCFVLRFKKHFLLWQDGGSDPDSYAMDIQRRKILQADTEDEIRKMAVTFGIAVAPSDVHVIDLDALDVILRNLRPSRRISQRASEKLLECWNAVDDLSRSLGVVSELFATKNDALSDAVYEKLFYGNNLPSVREDVGMFHPFFSRDEMIWLRNFFRVKIYKVFEVAGF